MIWYLVLARASVSNQGTVTKVLHDDVIKWKHQSSALLAICAGNSPVSGEFPAQRPVTRTFDVLFDLHLIKLLSRHSRVWWIETLSCPLWRQPNGLSRIHGRSSATIATSVQRCWQKTSVSWNKFRTPRFKLKYLIIGRVYYFSFIPIPISIYVLHPRCSFALLVLFLVTVLSN